MVQHRRSGYKQAYMAFGQVRQRNLVSHRQGLQHDKTWVWKSTEAPRGGMSCSSRNHHVCIRLSTP